MTPHLKFQNGGGEDEIDPPALAVCVVVEVVFNHTDHDLIAHERASVHDLLRLDAERGLLGDLLAKHVARGEMADTELFLDGRCLRTLACAQHGAGKICCQPMLAHHRHGGCGYLPAPGGPMRIIRSSGVVGAGVVEGGPDFAFSSRSFILS